MDGWFCTALPARAQSVKDFSTGTVIPRLPVQYEDAYLKDPSSLAKLKACQSFSDSRDCAKFQVLATCSHVAHGRGRGLFWISGSLDAN